MDQPAPYGTPEVVEDEPALDREVREGLHLGGPWRFAAIAQPLIPVAVVVLLGLLVVLVDLPTSDTAGAVYSLLAGITAGGATVLVGRPLARRYGGWRQAFGFDLPRPDDRRRVLGGLAVQFLARIVLVTVLAALSPGLGDSHGGNVEGLEDLPVPALLLSGVGAVIVAPLAEELAFRGVLLRALMRRFSFWPAALVSSALFALLHAGGAAHVAAIPLLVTSMLLFGTLQCLLVRRTGRLGPAMAVHGLMNLVVLVLSLSGPSS